MINKRIVLFIIIGVVLCTVFIYSMQNPYSRLLSDSEIQEFVEAKGIEPILINKIGGFYTMILFEDSDSNETFMYSVYLNKQNKIIEKLSTFSFQERADQVDIEMFGTSPDGNNFIGYVALIINSDEIASKAKEAKVVLDNGLVERGDFNGNRILLLPATKRYFWEKPLLRLIEVYDAEENVIGGFYTSTKDMTEGKKE